MYLWNVKKPWIGFEVLAAGEVHPNEAFQFAFENKTDFVCVACSIVRYGIKVKSSSSSPTARYADFMAMLEIARMYPEQIPPEVVIENSTLANKEVIAGQIKPAQSVQRSAVSRHKKAEKAKPKFSRDFVNTLTTTGKRREGLIV